MKQYEDAYFVQRPSKVLYMFKDMFYCYGYYLLFYTIEWKSGLGNACLYVVLTFIARQLALPENALSRHSTELITPYHVMRL